MEHWIVSRESIQCLVTDVSIYILSKLARLCAMKFIFTPCSAQRTRGYFNDADVICFKPYDDIEEKMYQLLLSSSTGGCKYKPNYGHSIKFSKVLTTTFDNEISTDEVITFNNVEIKIYGPILIAPTLINLSDDEYSINAKIFCPHVLYKLDIDCPHICIDIFRGI